METFDKLRETAISSKPMVDGLLLKAWRDEVLLPNGKTAIREYIRHPGAVIMLPLFPNGDTMLIRQFRYPVGKVFIELPAGKLDGGETLETAVQRELGEEIGYTAGRLSFVTEFYPCIGYSNEKMWLYVVEELTETAGYPDHDEFLEPLRVSLDEAIRMALAGVIDDMKTLAGLWLGREFIKNRRNV